MQKIIPPKLKPGDTIRIIAPSQSLADKTQDEMQIAITQLENLELKITFGKHVYETDPLGSSSIQFRIDDLHGAFKDPNIRAIICASGGFNVNQLLEHIDYKLIKNNPKIICGYSDITALCAAIYAKTGLLTYISPTFSSFTRGRLDEYTVNHFKQSLFTNETIEIKPSNTYTDWTNHDENGNEIKSKNEGYWILNEGESEGIIIGENLCTLNLLQGTEYFPDLTNAILFIEDDYESKDGNFTRDLQSLLHTPSAKNIRGMVIGRFQKTSEITKEKLQFIISTFPQLKNIPIIANADFGHTSPRITYAIGCKVRVSAYQNLTKIIISH